MFHMVFRPPLQELTLQFELNNGNCLVNLNVQAVFCLCGCLSPLYLKLGAGIVLIGAQRKGCQRKQK